MTPVRVERIAQPADLDEVLAIEEASFHNPTSRDWYARELERPDVCFLYVARRDPDGIVAFCAFWRVADQMHINNFAVSPLHRQQGVGAALLRHVLAEAAQLGVAEVTLEVRRSNHGAQRLYQRAGFTIVGERRRYYTQPIEDALVLATRLSLDQTAG